MTVQSIPASAIVNVLPGVINAGGTALDIIGLALTSSTRIPVGQVLSFASAAAVASYFGPTSHEANWATVYFLGMNNAGASPGALLMAQYPTAAVPAYIRGGSVSALTLAQLQAIEGTLSIVVDGETFTAGSLNLSAATSFSNAATIIASALDIVDATFTATISGTVMTVSAVATGTILVGAAVTGAGVTAGTTIVSEGSGTGGTGTYNLSVSSTVASAESMTAGPGAVSYDSVSGAFVITSGTTGVNSSMAFATGTTSTALGLTSAAGAVLSQGAAAATPIAYMGSVIAQTEDWVTFTTLFAPDTADCVSFAEWTNSQNNRFAYVLWDTSIYPTEQGDTSSAGYQIRQADYSGTILIYEPTDLFHAAFVMGAIASIDFTQVNGRTTLAFASQTGIAAGVTSQQIAANLIANGYNFYGAYATANQGFTFFYPGQITGPFAWIDSYIDEIWMNNAFQLALMELLTNIKSIPYNAAGYALIEAALADPINAAVSFGAIRAGVTLSSAQAAEVNNAAGLNIAPVLQSAGWYLLIGNASPEVRAARGTPPMVFWYMDGQSVQQMTLQSLEVA